MDLATFIHNTMLPGLLKGSGGVQHAPPTPHPNDNQTLIHSLTGAHQAPLSTEQQQILQMKHHHMAMQHHQTQLQQDIADRDSARRQQEADADAKRQIEVSKTQTDHKVKLAKIQADKQKQAQKAKSKNESKSSPKKSGNA